MSKVHADQNNIDNDKKAVNTDVAKNKADILASNINLLKIITALLVDVKIKESFDLDEELVNSEEFQRLYNGISDLRTISAALNKGELNQFVYSKGFILANLKALQSNLRHLTWQTKKIAEGDFSQKVNFLGEFSESFNKMSDKLKESNVQLLKLASLDALTKIPNRRSLNDFLDNTFGKHDDIFIFMMDIDHFKRVNDTFGHDVGDEVLIHVANTLSQQLRSTDFIARYGGEEFVAVLPATKPEIAIKIAERIVTALEQAPLVTSTQVCIKLTISIGVSSKYPNDQSYQDIIKRSDQALYHVKNTGRNNYSVYNDSMAMNTQNK